MNKVKFTALFALIILGIAAFSCKKQVQTELEGRWMKEAFVNSNNSDSATWTFNNGTLIIDNLTDSTRSDTGQYLVVEKNLKNYVRISNLRSYTDQQRLNGDWKVIQYKKDKLSLTKADENINTGLPSGNILREFTRIE